MIEFDRVGKRYRAFLRVGGRYPNLFGREVRALEDFTLELRAGEVFGIAGPNGAGKSTLISLMMGFLSPSEGTIRIDGQDPRRYIESHGIGYLSELINIPPAWRLTSALRRYALLAGVPRESLTQRVEQLIVELGLEEHRTKRVRQLSKGNLQRLGLAQALLCEERVIVLDEPTHGLDPVWTQRFRDVVNALRRPDRLVIIASHNLDELARVADRVGIMAGGRLQRVVDLRAESAADLGEVMPYRFVLARGEERVTTVFPGARSLGRGEYEVDALTLEAINDGLAALIQHGALLSAVYPVRSDLEQQFRDVVASNEDRA